MVVKKGIGKAKILQILMLFINPVVSVVLSLWFLLGRQHVNMLALAIGIASIFIYLPLAPDVASNFFVYIESDTYTELFFTKGLYVSIIKYFNEFFGLQYITVLFLYLTIILLIWFKVFEFYSSKIQNTSSYYYMLFFVIFSLVELRMMGLNKNYLAISLVYLFLFLKNINTSNSIFLYLLILLSILIHPSILLFVILYIVAKIIKNRITYLWILLLAIIGAFLLLPFLEYISQLLLALNNPILSYTLDYYIHNPIHGHIQMFGFYLKIRVIEIPFLFVVYYMGMQLMLENNSIWVRFILLLFATTIVFFFMHSLYERYSIASYIFSSFIVYQYIVVKGTKNFVLPVLSLLLIIRFLYLNIYNYGYIYYDKAYIKVLPNHSKKVEMMIKPAYIPTLFLLNVEKNGYSDKYIKSVTQYSGEVIH